MTIFTGKETNELKEIIKDLKETVLREKNLLAEIKGLYGMKHLANESLISAQTRELTQELNKLNERVYKIVNEITIPKTAFKNILGMRNISSAVKKEGNFEPDELEKKTLKRLKKEIKINKEIKKEIKEDVYAKLANSLFSNYSRNLASKNYFKELKIDLEKSNIMYLFSTYISIILFTTLLAAIAGAVLFLFFLFFSIQPDLPIIKPVEDAGSRLVKLIWILIAFPLAGFIISYSYPSLEKKSSEAQIDYELPFATVNMAAISGSLVNPVKIFEIMISLEEFPNVKKEFIKLVNHINVHGDSVVNSLRAIAYNTPSKKMSELLNGISTTINSGGDLTEFFKTRAETLLFDYKINREKETKTAETFMDLYISIVIAAPMIFMLLFMMMKISGLGISVPTSIITLIMVGGVAMINVFFLIFLHLKKTE